VYPYQGHNCSDDPDDMDEGFEEEREHVESLRFWRRGVPAADIVAAHFIF